MEYLTLDPIKLLTAFGYIGFTAIIFAESGILAGFFLPGDSLLFTAGFLASQDILSLKILLILGFIGAILGDSVGYALGRRFGPRIFKKQDSILLNEKNIEHARNFYERHGGKTLVFARFMPLVRTLAPIFAGVGHMRYGFFLAYNVIGGALWTASLLSLGFFLGNVIPSADRYLLPIIGVIVVISILPGVIHVLRNKETRKKILNVLENIFKK